VQNAEWRVEMDKNKDGGGEREHCGSNGDERIMKYIKIH
jgi:hypothetical protein